MNTYGLILTTDYEIFGNGSGCINQCMLKPGKVMADIAERYDAKITYFVDVLEIWQFRKDYAQGKLTIDFAEKIESQLRDFARKGHDIQLHFHPQWLDASYKGDGVWSLNNAYWRLYEVQNHPDWNLEILFKEGKQYLENLIQPINASYSCNVFRAGAWCIQPEEKILKAMAQNGFEIESSVAKGLKHDDGLTVFDFVKTADATFWRIENDVCKASKNGQILEIPISTVKLNGLINGFFTGLKILKRIPLSAPGCIKLGKGKKKNVFEKLKKWFNTQYKMLNYSDGTSFEELKYISKKFMKNNKGQDVPLVAISHPKTFGNINEFEKYLGWCSTQANISFSTYQLFLQNHDATTD